MKDFKAAIFDLDGTLADSMYVWEKVDRDFLASRNIPLTADYSEAVKTMFFKSAAEYTIQRYGFTETPQQIIDIWLDMAQNEYRYNVPLKAGILDYLHHLKSEGIALTIATSSLPKLTLPLLEHHGLTHLIDAICYTDEVGKPKSCPDVYLYAAQRVQARPEDCIVFEDIPQGIQSAKSVGMQTVAVYDQYSLSEQPLLKKLADKYIYSFDEMIY
ncbi:MAG: HAD family hydrolase [Acutalibacteraceae bacterium]